MLMVITIVINMVITISKATTNNIFYNSGPREGYLPPPHTSHEDALVGQSALSLEVLFTKAVSDV